MKMKNNEACKIRVDVATNESGKRSVAALQTGVHALIHFLSCHLGTLSLPRRHTFHDESEMILKVIFF
jgi:hypothetical protein